MSKEKINKEEFEQWKMNVITKKLFEFLKLEEEEINTTLLLDSILLEDSVVKRAVLVGKRDMVRDLLELDLAEDNNDEKTTTSF